jgi:hypothetical protein
VHEGTEEYPTTVEVNWQHVTRWKLAVSPSDFVLSPSGAMASLRQKENFTGLHTELNRRSGAASCRFALANERCSWQALLDCMLRAHC